MGLRRPPLPTVAVPDEETWLLWGHDLRAKGHEPIVEPGRAEVLIAPERVPEELAAATADLWARMPGRRRLVTPDAPVPGVDVGDVLNHHGASHDARTDISHAGHDDASEHEGHEGHEGHGDMMAITGEPSSDGLVMESIEVSVGPLGIALPTGLVVSVSLDGDVVAECSVQATLRQHAGASPVATACEAAELAGTDHRWLAAVEVERALSHTAWLHRLLRLLGWTARTEQAHRVAAEILAARMHVRARLTSATASESASQELAGELRTAAGVCAQLAQALDASRLLRLRTAGLGTVEADDARARGLSGPNARASGVDADARSREPTYRDLGFQPFVRHEGDAHARTLLRAHEAAQSLLVAARVLELPVSGGARRPSEFPPGESTVVEGPRGPISAAHDRRSATEQSAPGEAAALRAAGELAVGRELAAALVTIASFDLSPWSPEP